MGIGYKYKLVLGLAASTLVFASCNFISKKKEPTEKPIARAYDVYLYPNDIKNLVPKETKRADSTAIVKDFIQHWMEEQVLLHQAANNLDQQ